MAELAKFVQMGQTIDYTTDSSTELALGDPVFIGNLACVAVAPIAKGATGAVKPDGIWTVAKATGAVTLGADLYWDATNKNATTTASTNKRLGVAVAAAASADTTVLVMLNAGYTYSAG